jgi:hypothetical protein
VRRPLAVLVLLSLCSFQSQAFAFHVHAVSDHESDDHDRHGPAIHHHNDFEPTPHVDEKDTFGDVISIVIPVVATSASVALFAEFTEVLGAPELFLVGEASAVEVRSHGPPPSSQSFLRGPPSSIFL